MTYEPYDNIKFKETAPDCKAVYVNYMPRGKNGMRCWEIKARKSDGEFIVVVLRDCGYKIIGSTICIKPFNSLRGRNAEICRLYHEENLSQVFLANLFNMSQPSVSIIVNPKAK